MLAVRMLALSLCAGRAVAQRGGACRRVRLTEPPRCVAFLVCPVVTAIPFSRSPSYPPPGCGKSKSKLKSEQDGISKTHKLLRRTCSSAVKTDDVCATKSHRTFGRSLSSDPRAEQTVPAIKSHKLLNRPCPAAVKQEDCLTLKSHKLLTRSCSGDPRCEHNAGLKPHKLLSRSYSSNLRMEELYGLKSHKLLSKSYSGAPKSSKTELFKEPNAEGRRLSLTSGLIGILTPSSSSSSQPAVRKYFPLEFLSVSEGAGPLWGWGGGGGGVGASLGQVW